MSAMNYNEDICPVTEFRSDVNAMIQHTKTTHRPLILTQHGKPSVIVMDVVDFQRIIEKSELSEDIRVSQKQIIEGKTYTTAQAKSRIMKRFVNV